MKTNSVFYGSDGKNMAIAIIATSCKQALEIHNSVLNIPVESGSRMRTHWSKMPNDNPNHPELHNAPTGGIYYKKGNGKDAYKPLINYSIARADLTKT